MIWKNLILTTVTVIVGEFLVLLCIDFVVHSAVVSDYLILASDVSMLSTLGITCVPQLKNNVEVSVQYEIWNHNDG